MKFTSGFYTALGTPLDENGNILVSSFKSQVEDQKAAGAAGFLVLGSMGNQPSVKSTQIPHIVRACVEVVKGSCPVLVGVMDNSIARVNARVEALKGLQIDGIVATTPFYYIATQSELVNFYKSIAIQSPFPLFLYDLPLVTKTKITVHTVETLMREKAVSGIKVGDLPTARLLLHSSANDGSFQVIFSRMDVFDIAYAWGLEKNLDGMFSMLPKVTQDLYLYLREAKWEDARQKLDLIVNTRNRLFDVGIFRGFSACMNLLGYEGSFAPDYCPPLTPEEQEHVRSWMEEHKLL